MDTQRFGSLLTSRGFDFWSAVPCSYLAPLINWALGQPRYIASVNEGDAVASCAGAYLGGAKPVVMMQNAGLTNALSPLTSLTQPYDIPLLGFVSLRSDEPQHVLMGAITERLLDTINIAREYLSPDIEEAARQLHVAEEHLSARKSFFFIVRKGVFDLHPAPVMEIVEFRRRAVITKNSADVFPRRREVLRALAALRNEKTVFLTTTGYTSREMFETDDHAANFYMFGSLGCVSPCALGLAIMKPARNVVAVDGDGSLLMRLGTLSVNGKYAPPNMLHILLDNGVHESTGSQPTVAGNTMFSEVAADCGYPVSVKAHSIDDLINAYRNWEAQPALTFIHLKTSAGISGNLSRPAISPSGITDRIRTNLLT